ncbi:hypothetical protein KP509_24G070700 [Ceratopteris richardii]|uniref:Uncharacterized protein n=1 Tax=Ceratopteris richardii TaxID=49495 RepID=A0A8T2RXK6_CERRI|nr:hypothetical protein KP509_24G070700 [Ceratopteris richardii]
MKHSYGSTDTTSSMFGFQENYPSPIRCIECSEHQKCCCTARRIDAEVDAKKKRWFAACAMAYQYVQGHGLYDFEKDLNFCSNWAQSFTKQVHWHKEIHRWQAEGNQTLEHYIPAADSINFRADNSVRWCDQYNVVLQQSVPFYTRTKSSVTSQQDEEHTNISGTPPAGSTGPSYSRHFHESDSCSIYSITDIASIDDVVNPTQAVQLFGPHILASSTLVS